MSNPSIPFDPTNPGHVFACLGFLELSETFTGETKAAFRLDGPGGPRFELMSLKDPDPFSTVLEFLEHAQVTMLIPQGSELRYENKTDAMDYTETSSDVFPCPEPEKPEPLPVLLKKGSREFLITTWTNGAVKDNTKFWTGSRGMPGAVLARNALALVRGSILASRPDPFSLSAPQSSSFRFDRRRDTVPLRAGFSINNHRRKIIPMGYPLVEILAAIGLTHARPIRVNPSNGMLYQYSFIVDHLLSAVFHRAALGVAPLPFRTKTYSMTMDWAGQPGKARCIAFVTER